MNILCYKIFSEMMSTFENDNELGEPQIVSYAEQPQKQIERLHSKIFQKQNQINSEALQNYLDSIRASKLGNEQVSTQKAQITEIIGNLFGLLKRMMNIRQNQRFFSEILAIYIEMIKSRQNSKHYLGLLEEHLTQVLNMQTHRKKNKNVYEFIQKIFEANPHIAYKTLQSKRKEFQWVRNESIKIYRQFINFVASKKNDKQIIKEIRDCINENRVQERDEESENMILSKLQNRIDRLKVLLANFPNSYIESGVRSGRIDSNKSQNSRINHSRNSLSIIEQIYQFISALIIKNRKKETILRKILQLVKLFLKLPWTYLHECNKSKNQIILEYLKIQNPYNKLQIQDLLNDILTYLTIEAQTFEELKYYISQKVDLIVHNNSASSYDFKFLTIAFGKLKKNRIQSILESYDVLNLLAESLKLRLKEPIVEMLDILRNMNVHGTSVKIQELLKKRIDAIMQSQDNTQQMRPNSAGNRAFTEEDFRLALKCLRKFRFDTGSVYLVLKKNVFKNHLASKSVQYKRQVLKASLYVLTRPKQNKIGQNNLNKSRVMREIINIVNKDLSLKIMTIEWFRDQEELYEKKIFEIFKEPEFLHILFQDYASNHMLLKRFSIKVLCFIYPLNQCQIVPFLKRVYYHIYDRLSAEKLVSFQQKKQALSLTREILRHRTQIIVDDSASLCNFLYNDLHKCKTYQSQKQNLLLIQLFKTLVDLVRKAPKSVTPYIRLIGDFIIKLLNSKQEMEKVKNFALHAFNQIIRNCNYVLIPYFHFQFFFEILREMFKEGNRNIDSMELLRLLGNLGFLTKDKFNRIRERSVKLQNYREINGEFEKVYKQTGYLKSVKNIDEPPELKQFSKGPYLFTKQEVSYSYIQIQTFKVFILAKISKIISEQPSNLVNSKAFSVLEGFIPKLKKQQQSSYQAIIIEIVIKLKDSINSKEHIFSLISNIIQYQDTKKYHEQILEYLLGKNEPLNDQKQNQLMVLLYIVTEQYPQKAFYDEIIRKIIFYISELLTSERIKVQNIALGFKILENLADYIDNFLHLFLPQFNKLFLKSNEDICLPYFQLILTLAKKAPSAQFYLPQISETLYQLLQHQKQKILNKKIVSRKFIQKIINFALCMVIIFGDRFKSFIINFQALIRQVRNDKDNPMNHLMFNIAEKYMKKHSTLNYVSQAFTQREINQMFRGSSALEFKKVPENNQQQPQNFSKNTIFKLMEQFNSQQYQIEDESQELFNKICIFLYENSPNQFIRGCVPLVKEDRSFSHDVFPLAFYFFWITLGQDQRKKLVNKLMAILQNKVISLRIKQKFIDTIYFMGQWKSPIPLKSKFLCEICTEILDLAKALFYMENLYENDPDNYGESLIKKYCELEYKESALGMLKSVNNLNTKSKVLLYQKLKMHKKALKQYDLLPDPRKPQNMIIKITIQKEMSDWDSVLKTCADPICKNYKDNLAPLAVEAAVNLGKWEQVSSWLDVMQKLNTENQYSNIEKKKQRSYQNNLYIWKTMLMIHGKKYEQAQKSIFSARTAIYPKICQLFNFSFERTMEVVIMLQQLTELEETLNYLKYESIIQEEQEKKKKKLLHDEYKKRLQSLWNDRIEGSKRNLNAMQKILLIRNLLLDKSQNFTDWVDFCYLILRENQPQFAKRTLKILLEDLKDVNDQKKKFEIETLMIQAKFILGQIKDQQAVAQIEEIIKDKGKSKSEHSICRLYENCAIWLSEKEYDFNISKGNKCIELLEKTTQKISKYIRGWHLMGLMHLKMDELLEAKDKLTRKKGTEEQEINSSFIRQSRESHIFQALHCFLKSVSCGIKNHGFFLEDCLKILNILFNEETEVYGLIDEFSKYYTDIPTQGLIDIIPQIMSRLDVRNKTETYQMLKKLFVHIGFAHPHAIVFPIVFLRKGNDENRKKVAEQIYKEIIKKQKAAEQSTLSSKDSPKQENRRISQLFSETEKIVNQLCKVSLQLSEKFKIIIYKIYKESKTAQPKKVAEKYSNICKKLLNEKTSELSIGQFGFLQQYRQELSDIVNFLDIFMETQVMEFFRKAQRNISRIYEDLENSLRFIKQISLDQASPELIKIRNTNVCIPGTYVPNTQHIYISSFKPQLDVIDSKQRPKKLIILGSDEKQHLFLLKGKQDLRLDERIMQVFNLINKMFHDPVQQEKYSIQKYSITPISPETGLISWVRNCDTIGTLIIDYRRSTLPPGKIFLEIQESKKLSIDKYQKLPKPNKVEIYKEIEKKISGWDLRNVFWIRSMNSEEWLKSRSTYLRSLAVMSMVGYIIGLGDRHPHNIMVQRNTGKIVHIDFGDCFDVNRKRLQYPQKVPFRLTRMLIKAMQPCGVEGIFKHTCDKIVQMLRSNKESILTIIEAFRYDPIISWKRKQDDENIPTENSFIGQKQQIGSKKLFLFGNNPNYEFAQNVLNQVKKKLAGKTGNDTNKVMSPQDQVRALITEAMSPQNLVQHYQGWSIYW